MKGPFTSFSVGLELCWEVVVVWVDVSSISTSCLLVSVCVVVFVVSFSEVFEAVVVVVGTFVVDKVGLLENASVVGEGTKGEVAITASVVIVGSVEDKPMLAGFVEGVVGVIDGNGDEDCVELSVGRNVLVPVGFSVGNLRAAGC